LATHLQVASAVLNNIAHSIERYMDLASARQKLVASNIANAATPGYKAKDIDFQYEFHRAISEQGGSLEPLTRGPHHRLESMEVIEVPGLEGRNDGNNVGLDRERRLLAENAIRFNIASNLWKAQYRQLKSAIQEAKNG
jgi:flagellar basal-body rod protein FlgB